MKIYDNRRTAKKRCPKCKAMMVRLKKEWGCANCGLKVKHKLK
jgi:ribosomal protein L37AE/L43A